MIVGRVFQRAFADLPGMSERLDAGLAAILIGAQPAFVTLLAYRYDRRERPRGWTGITGIGLGLLGLLLLFGRDLHTGPSALTGGGLVVAAAVCYAAGGIMIHRRYGDAPPLGVATSSMLITTVALAAPTAVTLPDHLPTADVLAALVVLGVVCTGATLALFHTLIVRIGLARRSVEPTAPARFGPGSRSGSQCGVCRPRARPGRHRSPGVAIDGATSRSAPSLMRRMGTRGDAFAAAGRSQVLVR